MKKADITMHYDYGRAVPAVNVKVDAWRWADGAGDVARELGADDPEAEAFVAYCDRMSDDHAESLFGYACESQFELWRDDVRELLGDPRRECYTAGRSGGWVYVDGWTAADVESWDAIAVARWAKLATWARDAADAVPAVMAEIAFLNGWTAARDEEARYAEAVDGPDLARAIVAARCLPAVRATLYGSARQLAEVTR